MSTIPPGVAAHKREAEPVSPEDDEFRPLTAGEAAALRREQPQLSLIRVLLAQVVVGVATALMATLLTGRASVGWSAAYGAAAVVIPAALFARGLVGKMSSLNAGAAVFAFFMWEFVKIALTVALLALAPRVVEALSWPAMLIGMLLAMKVYWLALGWRRVFAAPSAKV